MIDKYIIVYLDDILVYSESATCYKKCWRSALQWLRENKLYAKIEKCEFGESEVKYFRYIVGYGKLYVN